MHLEVLLYIFTGKKLGVDQKNQDQTWFPVNDIVNHTQQLVFINQEQTTLDNEELVIQHMVLILGLHRLLLITWIHLHGLVQIGDVIELSELV
jgi:hypothetical protein